ncbi:adenylate cyclase type 10-like [Cetorhinus maximus]
MLAARDCSETTKEKNPVWRCKQMRFCIALVHETANDLWLKEQKKSLHMKCTKFLENAARKCKTCGEGDFIYQHRKMVTFSIVEPENALQRRKDLYGTASHVNLRSDSPDGESQQEFIQKMDAILKECEGNSQLYAKDCECKPIMESVYCSLVRHWMGAGNVAKTFFYLLETAAAASQLSNNLMALSYLTEAENILTALRKGIPPFEYADVTKNSKIFPFEKACLYSLKAEMQLSIGHLQEAEILFKKSLTLLNKKFPSFGLSQLIAYGIENYKNSKRHREKEDLTGVTEEEISPIIHQQIRCLSFLWQIFCLQKYTCKLPAMFTILLELNTAEISNNEFKVCFNSIEANKTFKQIISAYIDSFRCYHFVGFKEKSAKMERLALQKCLVLNKDQNGLQMIGNLVCALSEMKLCTGRLAESIEYGFALRPFDECLAFINGVIDDPVIKSEKSLLLVLHSSVALWYSRLAEWNEARPSFKMAKRLMSYTNASLFSMYGYSKFLECQILVFRKALWERQETVMEVYQQTKELHIVDATFFSSSPQGGLRIPGDSD